MNRHAPIADAGLAAGVGLLSMLALSLVFPALASPVALAIGAAAGLAIAYRDRLPHESPLFRLGLALLAIAAGIAIWLSLQPRYITI